MGKEGRGMEIISVDLISSPAWRTNEPCERTLHKLCYVIKKYGQIRNITVRQQQERYEVIEGRWILHAVKAAGIPFVWAKNAGVLDDLEARERNLILNELRFSTDFVDLAEHIKALSDSKSLRHVADIVSYEFVEVQKFPKILSFDWEKFNRSKVEGQGTLFALGVDQNIIEDEEGSLDQEGGAGNDQQHPDGNSNVLA